MLRKLGSTGLKVVLLMWRIAIPAWLMTTKCYNREWINCGVVLMTMKVEGDGKHWVDWTERRKSSGEDND